MERFEHGGDIYAHPGVIDFSASLNPLGMPARTVEALRQGVRLCASYPDPQSRELAKAIAGYERVDEEKVLVCAGATDAITRLCHAVRPDRAMVCAPCYSGYEQALRQVGAWVKYHLLCEEEGFALTESVVDDIDRDVQLVFLANPNNPTGRCVDRGVLLRCLDRARAVGAVVVLDECFIDLTDQLRSTDLLESFENLVIVKAFTKSFALAGLRLGYALSSNAGLLERMRDAGQPWAVSVPAQVAGVASLSEVGYLEKSCALIAHERSRLHAALEELGFTVVPSDANYLLFYDEGACGADLSSPERVVCKKDGDDACSPTEQGVHPACESVSEGRFRSVSRVMKTCPPSLFAQMLDRGILIRSCENFVGLGLGWYRIAVRTSQENDCLIRALREVVDG